MSPIKNSDKLTSKKRPADKPADDEIVASHEKSIKHCENECDKKALKTFIDYLRIPSVHPKPNYWATVDFLVGIGESLDLIPRITEPLKDYPMLILEWTGTDPSLPGIFCSSHMDVVPVYEEKWTQPPFAANIIDGWIYARGTQDMKSVGVHQLESVRRLKAAGLKHLLRTVYFGFTVDEEVGSTNGMNLLVQELKIPKGQKDEIRFHDLNIACHLDEGLPSTNSNYLAFYEERSPWFFTITCHGDTGHGSAFVENLAVEKVHRIVTKLMEFRAKKKSEFESFNGKKFLGDVTTLNINGINGGVQANVVPAEMTIMVDIRLTPAEDFEKLSAWIEDICKSEEAVLNFTHKTKGRGKDSCTPPDLINNAWWSSLKETCDEVDAGLDLRVFQGATDARFVRNYPTADTTPEAKRGRKIEVINFSAIRNTPMLLHDHDERISTEEFLQGCRVYASLLKRLGNIAPQP